MKLCRNHYLLQAALFCLIAINATAQKAPVKWGKIDKDELKMKKYNADPDADAVVLCDFGTLTYDFSSSSYLIEFVRHKRIKFLKRSALDKYGDVAIPFYHHENTSDVKKIQAIVTNPDGEKHKISNSDIIKDKINDYWSVYKFSFPQLKEGSVAEYRYTVQSNRLLSPVEWYFQSDIPTVWSELNMEIPDMYEYVFLTQGQESVVQENETIVKSIPYSVNRVDMGAVGRPPSTQTVKGTTSLRFNRYRFVMENVPAMEEENFITSMENYYAKTKLQLKTIRPVGEVATNVMHSWEKLATELWDHTYFGDQINAKRHGQNLVETVFPEGVPDTLNDRGKADLLYRWISSNIHWNGQRAIITGSSLTDVLRKREGTGAELNLLLVAGLNQLGIDALPAMVSTRSHGRTLEIYPFIDQFDHVIAYVKLGNEVLFLDVNNEEMPLGVISLESQNYRAWVVDPAAPFWTDINIPRTRQIWLVNSTCDEEGNLIGEVQSTFEGYYAVNNRRTGSQVETNDFLTSFYTEGLKSQFENVRFDTENTPNEPLALAYDFRQTGLATTNNEFIYFNPFTFQSLNTNPLKQETRNFPVEIPYPREDKFIFNITLPEGYAVEELPESIRFNLLDHGASFSYLANDMGHQVQLIINMKINRLYYEPEEYDVIRQFFIQVQKKVSEQIVLKKT